jgi:chemosensory pili system protein ChpA (sensor histidine kinase/response regulator)
VPTQLQAMRGVFTVLGLDDAAVTCVRMRDEIDRLSNTEVDPTLSGPQAVFERLATNLGQLGFLIDMLSVQAPLAKAMFRFDEARGELVATVERERRSPRPRTPVPAAVIAAPAAQPIPTPAAPAPSPSLAPEPVRAPEPAPLSLADFDLPDLELPPLDAQGPEATQPLELDTQPGSFAHVATEPMGLRELAPAPVPAPEPLAPLHLDLGAAAAPDVPEDEAAIDAEMLEIFLEEANEVIGSAREATAELRDTPTDRAQLTNVRRAFHTLKGSGRMVGLNAFGEGAWACEQLFNALIADEKPADHALLQFTVAALDELDSWRAAIEAGDAAGRSPASLRAQADRLRLGAPAPVALAPELEASAQEEVEVPVEATVEATAEALAPSTEAEEVLDISSLDGLTVEEQAPAPEMVEEALDLDLALPDLGADIDFSATLSLKFVSMC